MNKKGQTTDEDEYGCRTVKKIFKVEIEYSDQFDYDENSISDYLTDLDAYTIKVSEVKEKKK